MWVALGFSGRFRGVRGADAVDVDEAKPADRVRVMRPDETESDESAADPRLHACPLELAPFAGSCGLRITLMAEPSWVARKPSSKLSSGSS